jgi:hypothetical protein
VLPIGALVAFVSRQLGRLLSLAFGWATLVLFGKVSKDKQLLLSIMALLSLVWPVAIAGVAVPSVGTFLLGLVTVPAWIENWVRIGMLVLAVAAPLGVGYVASRLRDQRPALDRSEIRVREARAPWPLAVPGRILALVGGAGVRALVPKQLVQLRGKGFVITIHPMDLGFTGEAKVLARVRAALVRELAFTEAYQTWTKESQEIEDALMRADQKKTSVETIARQLATIEIPYEEWEILYRILLQVRLRRDPIGTDEVGRNGSGRPGLLHRIEAAITALRS